jgi:hypothetical protein
MVPLIWIGAMRFWLAATVLRGRRDSFAFGTRGQRVGMEPAAANPVGGSS